jgi:hypothetical protein
MLAELREDNQSLTASLREAHNVCEEHRDIATASLIEVWVDETERRTWFLFESTLRATNVARRCELTPKAPSRRPGLSRASGCGEADRLAPAACHQSEDKNG